MDFKLILKKLQNKGYLKGSNDGFEDDYDLIDVILKKRELKQKQRLKKAKDKSSEIDAFLYIIEEQPNLFNNKELCFLYENIFNKELIYS